MNPKSPQEDNNLGRTARPSITSSLSSICGNGITIYDAEEMAIACSDIKDNGLVNSSLKCTSKRSLDTNENIMKDVPISPNILSPNSVVTNITTSVEIVPTPLSNISSAKGKINLLSNDQDSVVCRLQPPHEKDSMLCVPEPIAYDRRQNSLTIITSTWASLHGVFLSFVSAIFFSLTTVIVKEMHDVHPGLKSCFRFAGILLFSIPVLSDTDQNPLGPKNLRIYILARGFAGATSLYLRYCALQYLPLSNATVIVLSMPVFVCIFARIFLKESCGVFHAFALLITLAGISLSSKLDIIFGKSDEEAAELGIDRKAEILGLSASMGATLVGSASYVVIRKIKTVHNSVILFNFAWVAIIETSTITYFLNGFTFPTCGVGPWGLCGLAVLSFYAQWFLTKSLQVEEAGLVSVTRASSEVIFAFIFQIIFFRQTPDRYSVLGALLVTSAVVLTGIRKWIANKGEDHLARRIFAFTLK